MPKIHITLQGKGGVAKTTNSAIMAQFIIDVLEREVLCIDTDPVNASFHAYNRLKAESLQIMQDGDINPRAWDSLVEKLCRTKKDVVVDNGSSSFTSILGYINKNLSLEIVQAFNHEIYIHIPIAGSEGLGHTLSWMEQIIQALHPQGPKFVVWLNPFLGPIEKGGQSFEGLEEYLGCKKYLEAIIQVPSFVPAETFGRDIGYLLTNNLTFNEALEMVKKPVKGGDKGETEIHSVHGFEIAMLQRIKIIRKRLYDLLEASGVFA